MLRLCGALQDHWLEDVVILRRCEIAGRVTFADLRNVPSELISMLDSVREYVQFTRPRLVKTASAMVDCFY